MHSTLSRNRILLPALTLALAFAGCAAAPKPLPPDEPVALANPASVNCVRLKGTLTIVKREDGGEYGVCRFADGRQCEEWALFRGTCTPEAGAYDDPFAYCASVGNIDAPDQRYQGAAMPDAVVREMVRLGIVAATAPAEFQRQATWRCLEHTVRVCHYGANIPCREKADASQALTRAMADYCRENRGVDAIPAAVTGRATVYAWACRDGEPRPVKQQLRVDSRGYLADFWYELAPGQTP